MPDPTYQRLDARAHGLGGISSLWLGDGHVLQVVAALGIETYRRWYLREIQAMIILRTSRRVIWNLIWGILGGLAFAAAGGFVGLAATSAKEHEAQVVFQVFAGLAGAVAALCAGAVVWNSLLGPTCTLFVQTPAGLVPLAAPVRRRAAERLLARLRPLIEAAQLENSPPPAA
jgi:hypothetical protein